MAKEISDEQAGKLQLRWLELFNRTRDGRRPYETVMDELQRMIEDDLLGQPLVMVLELSVLAELPQVVLANLPKPSPRYHVMDPRYVAAAEKLSRRRPSTREKLVLRRYKKELAAADAAALEPELRHADLWEAAAIAHHFDKNGGGMDFVFAGGEVDGMVPIMLTFHAHGRDGGGRSGIDLRHPRQIYGKGMWFAFAERDERWSGFA